jgi:hypothetical protein
MLGAITKAKNFSLFDIYGELSQRDIIHICPHFSDSLAIENMKRELGSLLVEDI